MPEPVFYMRGFPGPGHFDGTDPTMLAHLALIADLSAEEVQDLSDALSQVNGFLHTSALRELIGNSISDADTSQAVLRALQNLEPDDLKRVLRRVDRARKSDDVQLHDGKMKALRRNLLILIQIYPALARFEKALRLATLTG